MNHKFLIIFVAVLFILGCEMPVKFNEGLDIKFKPGSPPNKFEPDEAVDLILEVKNLGKRDLDSGDIDVKLVGAASEKIFNPTILETHNYEVVEKDGGKIKIDLGSIMYEADLKWTYRPDIEVDVCYDYGTDAYATIYISDKPDEIKKHSAFQNSKGPVIARNLNEELGGKFVKFDFEVIKVGKGEIVSDCGGDKGRVMVSVSGASGIECSTFNGNAAGSVELDNGKKKISCKVAPSKIKYQTQLQVFLSYKYQQHVSKQVTIEKPE